MKFAIAKLTSAITASGQSFVMPVAGAGFALVQMIATTLVGHICQIEGSIDSTDGTDGNWFAVSASRSSSPATIEQATGSLSATPVYFWSIPCDGMKYIRFRSTSHTSGTATYTGIALEDGGAAILGKAGNSPSTPNTDFYASLATTNGRSVKGSGANVYSITASNLAAAAKFLKLYNKASAPTVGTDVPVMTIPVPAGGSVSLELGAIGIRFTSGLAMAITGASGDTDTTAVAAGDVRTAISYL